MLKVNFRKENIDLLLHGNGQMQDSLETKRTRVSTRNFSTDFLALSEVRRECVLKRCSLNRTLSRIHAHKRCDVSVRYSLRFKSAR